MSANRRARYLAHLESPLWQAQRKSAFVRWGRYCNCCGLSEAIHVHHLNYRQLTDVTPEDLMPLCEVCHRAVHAIPELDQMARVDGDAMEKRRMVLFRVRAKSMIVTVHGGARIPSKKELRVLKRKARLAERIANAEDRRANSVERQARIEHRNAPRPPKPERIPSRNILLKILCSRYREKPERFDGWPDSTLHAIHLRRCVPIFCRPDGCLELAACGADEMINLSSFNLSLLRSPRGSFTAATARELGFPDYMQLPTGWIESLVGKVIPRQQYLRAKASRTIYAGCKDTIAL